MTGWEAYALMLAERRARAFEDQLIAAIVAQPGGGYAPNDALNNNHTTTGKSWIEAEMAKHKHPLPFKPSLNHRVSVTNCTP